MASSISCPFCSPDPTRVVIRGKLCYALRDLYPVNPGHTLLIPYRHVASWFDATEEERAEMLELAERVKTELDGGGEPPDGYNLGVNVGETAGQTVIPPYS